MSEWAELERAALARFAAPAKRERMLALAVSGRPAARAKLAVLLAGDGWVSPDHSRLLQHDETTPERVAALMRAHGAGDLAWLVHASRAVPLPEALGDVVGQAYGALVLSGTVQQPVGYLETEVPTRYLLT